MRVVIQRVKQAAVTVDSAQISSIGIGLLCYVSYAATDTDATMQWIAGKITGLRVFPAADGNDRFDQSVQEIGGDVLIVSNFTLHADCRKGRRPDFINAASPSIAREMHNKFIEIVKASGIPVKDGQFGAHMVVKSENDGPVTFVIDKE